MEDLLGAVGDVQDRRPVLPQHRQEVLQLLHVLGAYAGGRLVHDDEPRREAGELRELDELLDRAAVKSDGPFHVHVQLDGPQRRGELLPHLPPVVEEEELPDLPVHEDVLDRAQSRQETGLAGGA